MKIFLSLCASLFLTLTVMASNLHEFEINDIHGKPMSLADFKGKTVLVVNVASRCGMTPQYEGLQALYEQYADRGFVILGVPANNFGSQEPGTDAEILEFCQSRFSVTFPMTTKVDVRGPNAHALYQWLASEQGEPKWNFHKYLINGNGELVAAFGSRVAPNAPEVIAAIEESLN